MPFRPRLGRWWQFSKDYRKVPIVLIDGEQFNDSSAIIDEIELVAAAAADDSRFFPALAPIEYR